MIKFTIKDKASGKIIPDIDKYFIDHKGNLIKVYQSPFNDKLYYKLSINSKEANSCFDIEFNGVDSWPL